MDTRIQFAEVFTFIRNLKADYNSGNGPSKADKKQCFWRFFKLTFANVWSGLTAPLVYPFWYMFRKSITEKIYAGTSWEAVNSMIEKNQTEEVKKLLKKNGAFLYWLWTYGDLRDPLGRGELQFNEPNTFWYRFKENALRNPRFTINFMEWRTGNIVEVYTVIDKRDFTYMHTSEGIGDSPDGIYFKWMKDNYGRWGFIYEDNNSQNIFYIGNVGLLKKDIGHSGRFEIGYRKTGSSYWK